MTKRRTSQKHKRKKLNSIDNLQPFSRQPRSPAPKRRSDFSSFFSSTSISISGSLRHGFSSVTMASSDDTKAEEESLAALAVVLHCGRLADKKAKLLSKCCKPQRIGIESVAQNTLLDHCDNSVSEESQETIVTENKAILGESSSFCATPGNVVWAKTDSQMWWPAEIIGETSSIEESRNEGIGGHVLVQFYGDHGSAWVDPASDLSQLEICFEERSCNTMENFQDALKQALKKKEDLSSHRQVARSSDESSHPSQQDEPCDKCTSSISSRTESDIVGRRKSTRIPKQKLRFGDVVFPPKSPATVRRLRIMRYLGLIAPVGSPF